MTSENKLSISWKENSWVPHLTPHNILAYFCQRSNPFYDKTCNNEIAKMQRLNAGQLLQMKGKQSLIKIQGCPQASRQWHPATLTFGLNACKE